LKRCTEPLAWNLDPASAVAQTACPLFSVIPKEIRDFIFEFALTEYPSKQPHQEDRRQLSLTNGQPDRAENLLLTCKAVYLETYLLPLTLNPVRFPHFVGISNPSIKVRLPWQFANIQSLDVTLPQVALECNDFHDFLHDSIRWNPEARHRGVYVSPYVGLTSADSYVSGSCQSFDFTLLPASRTENVLPLRAALEQMQLPESFTMPQSSMRLQRARPLVHLTLRLTPKDWWTWTDDPDSTDPTQHLGLDPTLGNGDDSVWQRPTSTGMQQLAQQRRDGYDVVSKTGLTKTFSSWRGEPGWAHAIGKLPDLKTLELVLETFEEKKAQLEAVVECAKTWRFPVVGNKFELVWSGEVKEYKWSKVLVESWETRLPDWYARKTEFVGRTVRFTRRRRPADDESCKVH
jgi:hypothetical protein